MLAPTRCSHLALLAAALALAACARPPEPPGPATRLRLWVDGAAQLTEGPPVEPPELLYASDFASELAAWAPTWDVGRTGPGPEVRTPVEDGRTLLELGGEHGALERIFAVEPDTCYVFEGLVRAEGIESEPARLDGARFWLAEASGPATYAELCTTKAELLGPDWTSPSAASGAGWTPMRHLFVTRSRTQYLHVVCALSTRATVRAGRVQFADLRLERHPRDREWVERLQQECARRAATDPPAAGDQGRRRLAAELGGESRPSLVLLPGERLRIPLPPLASGARLVLGAGAWPPDALPFRGQDPRAAGRRAELGVLLDGATLLERPLELARKPVEARWEPLEVALADGARELELVSRGSLPLVLGAPLVTTAAPAPPRPSVLLVSIDTLRADHFGPAEGRASFTPHLDRLAARALVCADASAPSPYTLPSHATLLTGQFPSVHGVVAHENRLSRTRSTSLAERLGREGYATAAFTAGGFVHPAFGLDQGFERFTLVDPIREHGSHFHRTLQRKIDPAEADRRMLEQGLEGVEGWLRAHAGAPFLLFLHTYTVHDYDVPPAYLACAPPGCTRPQVPLSTPSAAAAEAYTPAMRAHIRHLYEAALRYTDERLG
ncbi:MAG TPA: sulfatase-like hydrolase/transferase, partial [Planctomycetota bacterium]